MSTFYSRKVGESYPTGIGTRFWALESAAQNALAQEICAYFGPRLKVSWFHHRDSVIPVVELDGVKL